MLTESGVMVKIFMIPVSIEKVSLSQSFLSTRFIAHNTLTLADTDIHSLLPKCVLGISAVIYLAFCPEVSV